MEKASLCDVGGGGRSGRLVRVDCEGGISFVGGGCVVFGGQGGERGRSSMGGRSSSMIGN